MIAVDIKRSTPVNGGDFVEVDEHLTPSRKKVCDCGIAQVLSADTVIGYPTRGQCIECGQTVLMFLIQVAGANNA